MTQLRWTIFLIICAGALFYFNRQEQQRLQALRVQQAAKLKAEKDRAPKDLADKKTPDDKGGVAKADVKGKAAPAKQGDVKSGDNAKPAPPKPVVDNRPEIIIPLGLDEDFGKFRILASVSTRGAVIKDLTLLKDADKRVRERYMLLKEGRSYGMDLGGEDLGNRNWDVVDA